MSLKSYFTEHAILLSKIPADAGQCPAGLDAQPNFQFSKLSVGLAVIDTLSFQLWKMWCIPSGLHCNVFLRRTDIVRSRPQSPMPEPLALLQSENGPFTSSGVQ
jgi:hypothetical protein